MHVCFVTEIKRLTFSTYRKLYMAHHLDVYSRPICTWIQQNGNGWLIEFSTMSIPDNRPMFSTNTYLS